MTVVSFDIAATKKLGPFALCKCGLRSNGERVFAGGKKRRRPSAVCKGRIRFRLDGTGSNIAV